MRQLKKIFPVAECALHHESAFQLLVATILSAQCTDERVNIVTKELFAKHPTVYDIDKLTQKRLEKIIQSTGFFRNKATNIRLDVLSGIEEATYIGRGLRCDPLIAGMENFVQMDIEKCNCQN